MLSAYFDLPQVAPNGKRRKPKTPKPTEASTTNLHVKFEPLPPEKNIPKAAEEPGQAWQALDESVAPKDDDVAEWNWDSEEEHPASEVSEPDFEPESLDIEDSVASSMESHDCVFARRKTRRFAEPAVAVYSGPELCCEDEDFD